MPWPASPDVDDGLDHRHGDADAREALHLLEHLLAEARFARRDLQLGLAGDAIDRVVEPASTLWLAVCMPTNTATPSTMPAVVSSVRSTCLRKYGQLIRAGGASLQDVVGDAAVAERHDALAASRDVHVVRHDDDRGAEAGVQVRMSARMSWPVRVSRLPVGSSASRIGG